MKQFFEIAVKDRMIAESPFAKATTRFKKPQAPERHAPTEAQFYALLESVRSQVSRFAADTGDFIQFLGEAGLGQAEAASLTWGQVDWQSNRLRIRRHKTGSWFWVPIYYRLQPLLERLRAEAGTNSTPTSRVFKILDGKKALTAACQRLEFHHFSQRNLRQFHIIRMLKAGVSVKLISKWQGHSDGGKLIWDTYSDVIGADDAQYECQQLDKLKPQTAQYPDFQPDDDGEYERQQLTKLIPKPILPTALQQAPPAANGSHQHTNSLGMENPFKPNEIVTTKVKGAGVTATVVQVFNNEVQVKTLDGKLLWRTMFTVWRVGASPIPKPQKPKVEAVPAPAPAASASAESIAQPDGTPAAENSGGESTGKPTEAEAQPAAAVPAKQSKRRKGRKHRL